MQEFNLSKKSKFLEELFIKRKHFCNGNINELQYQQNRVIKYQSNITQRDNDLTVS